MKLLHIDASIAGEASVSREVSAAVVETLRQAEPDLDVTYRDLAAQPLEHLTLAHLPGDHPIAAAIAAGRPAASVESGRAVSGAVLDEFIAADIVVIGAPMYNFTIPSQLKAWIDRIVIPGRTFRYTETGVQGLAGGKQVIVALARGGFYGPGMPAAAAEHAQSYLRTVFGFIGVTDVRFIVAEGVQVGPEHRQKALSGALQTAAALSSAVTAPA